MIRSIRPGDPDWPAGLKDLADPPSELWLRGGGDLAQLCERPTVAIVGSRACTSYGEHVAYELSHFLAQRGVVIISGGAYGIDAVAHRAATRDRLTPTIAVLACGVDRVYPPGNASLFERIVTDGLLVSQFPPGSAPQRTRFLARNEVLVALADAVIVVEAARQSGSLAAAHRAHDIGRPVLAIPGPVTSPMSIGCHQLITQGIAELISDFQEILPFIERPTA